MGALKIDQARDSTPPYGGLRGLGDARARECFGEIRGGCCEQLTWLKDRLRGAFNRREVEEVLAGVLPRLCVHWRREVDHF
jgi:hypothetical protein